MVSLKILFSCVLAVQLTALLFLYCSQDTYKTDEPKRELLNDGVLQLEKDLNRIEESQSRFVDVNLAYGVLKQLDIYKPPNRPDLAIGKTKRSYLGFKKDDDYCEKHRAYFVEYPESIFEEMNIVHMKRKDSYLGSVISSFANDLHSHHVAHMTKKEHDLSHIDIRPETNLFFTSMPLHLFFNITQQVSCISQMSNQIPGCDNIASKHKVAQAVTTYMDRYQNRPECLAYDKYFPQTWVLSNITQCRQFFNNLNSDEYKKLQEERTIVYMKKIPRLHRGMGVLPFNIDEETQIRKQYENGTLCGQIKEDIIMQHYIHNPLLLNGRKFDFRMGLLIASVNPLIAYYHDGLLRVSLVKYDAKSNDKKALLTNLALNEQIYDDAKNGHLFEGMQEEELREAQQWTFERLQAYLLDTGVISDPNWLENYLRPEFKKALIHLIRLSSDQFLKHSSFYGFFGVDFMLDTDLKLWFIEANAAQAFEGYSQTLDKIVSKMIKDHFEVIYGLLRSRMKRVVRYVNMLIEAGKAYENGDREVIIEDLEKQREVFEQITKNYFEIEFDISEDNGFEKIIDENEKGVAVYQGLLDEGCL